jgi:integrase
MAKGRKSEKAEYGSGSVYPNKDGSWMAAVRLRPGEKPVRRQAPDRAGAEAIRAELVRLRDAKVDVIKGSQPVEEFTDYWFNEVYLQKDLAERSNKHTLDMLELHILPVVGKRPMLEVDHAELQKLLNDMGRRPESKGGPLSAQTIHHVYNVLKPIFAKALTMGIVERNPTIGLSLPEVKRPQKPVLEIIQVLKLLATVEEQPDAVCYHLMAFLGFRLGEVLPLRRIDFNQDFSEVRIDRAISYHTLDMDAPKRDSKRLLPVPPRLATRCAVQWERVKALQHDPTPDFAEHGLLCPSEVGTPIQPSNFEKRWHGYTQRRQTKKGVREYRYPGIKQRADLPDATVLHDLRSFMATMLVDLDIAQRTIGHILGHGAKDVSERYMRRHLPTMRRALEKLEDAVWSEAESKEQTG